MVAELSTRKRLRRVAESAKRIRALLSSDDASSTIELARIAGDIERDAIELEREFAELASPVLSPGQ